MSDEYALVATCVKFPDDETSGCERLFERLSRLCMQGVDRLDVFVPHPEYDQVPFFKDGRPPAVLVEFAAPTPEALRRLAESKDFQAVFAPQHSGAQWSAGYFRIVRHPVRGEVVAHPRQAQASFVVRYYPPVADAAHFAAHYVANHPPILARLPGIRNVLCYVPLGGAVLGCARDETVIRNEVVFDDIACLVRSLHSPLLAELRADSRAFPPFGHSTHHAMLRSELAAPPSAVQ